MLEIIRYDETNPMWTRDDATNRAYLECQAKYIPQILHYKDYIYFNQIYEQLNVEWNPERHKNVCYLAEFGELHIDIEPTEGYSCYLIKIYQK